MRIPKKYGQSKIDRCPFCDKTAVMKNSQDVPVCVQHKNAKLENLKCICGEWLDVSSGKYGPYFRCLNCGNVSFTKGLEMNPQIGKVGEAKEKIAEKKEMDSQSIPAIKKETIIRSDDPNYFY